MTCKFKRGDVVMDKWGYSYRFIYYSPDGLYAHVKSVIGMHTIPVGEFTGVATWIQNKDSQFLS